VWTHFITEPWRRCGIVVVLLLCGAVVTGCGGHDEPAEDAVGAAATIGVTSTAFADGASIPVEFTCDGNPESPPLAWTGVAGATPAAWALVVDDPDAPGGTFVHWVVLDIPPTTRSIAAGKVPAGSTQAMNSAGSTAYAGPCPPSGTHHYRFTVYALSAPTGLPEGAATEDALAKIRSAAEAKGTLLGLYARTSS
jgi:Raf kinase inhibitor-like YbhB/YbcL family protein